MEEEQDVGKTRRDRGSDAGNGRHPQNGVRHEHHQSNDEQDGRPEWKTVYKAAEPSADPAFAAVNGALIVEVSRLDVGRPLYSLSIGSTGARGFRKFISFKYEGSGVIRAADSSHELATRIQRLVDDAVGFILGELQTSENARVARASAPRRNFADPGRP